MADITFEYCEDVRRVSEKIINTVSRHKHLMAARIAYLKRISPGGWYSKDHVVLAQVRKSTPLDHFLTEYDLVLTVNGLAWDTATESQKEVLVDHELCHVAPDTWTIIGHDLEEFVEVVRRHGLWREGLLKLVEAAQAHGFDLQLNLPMTNYGMVKTQAQIQSGETERIEIRADGEPRIIINPDEDAIEASN